MGFLPGGVFLVPLIYLVVLGVIGFVVYLAVRFAIRDGLRGHHLWLERTNRGPGAGRGEQ